MQLKFFYGFPGVVDVPVWLGTAATGGEWRTHCRSGIKKKIKNCIPQCDDRNASERRMPTVASGQGSNWQHITASPCRKLKELDAAAAAAAAAASGVAVTLCSVARVSGIILPLQIKLHIPWILYRIAPELHYVVTSPTLSFCNFYIYDLYIFCANVLTGSIALNSIYKDLLPALLCSRQKKSGRH